MKSNYKKHDIFSLMLSESQNTIPTHVLNQQLFIIDLPEGDPDLELADALLIRRPVAEAAHA